jgi:hypothetical protein
MGGRAAADGAAAACPGGTYQVTGIS